LQICKERILTLYNLTNDFTDTVEIDEDIVYEEELSSISIAKKQIDNNEYIDAEDFDW
jgi:prevent-host-death family protein